MIRKLLAAAAACVLILIVVVVANTVLISAQYKDRPDAIEIVFDEQAVAKRLGTVVQFPTISYEVAGPVARDAFKGLTEFLRMSYPKVHELLELEIISDYSLLYKWQGTNPALKPIMLISHTDVVPVEPGTEGNWEHPAFSGEVVDGFIWGRGTLDYKVSVLAAMEAVEFLLGQEFSPARTIYMAFGHDEEIGGANGAAKIAERLAREGVELDFTLDEGTVIANDIIPGISRPVALVGVAEKGYLTLRLEAQGLGGHSSMPPTNTAIGKLARALARLEANQMPARLEPPVTTMFDHLAPEMSFWMRLVMANRWLFGPILVRQLEASPTTNAAIRTTTAITMTSAGVKPNVLPAAAEAVVNFRIMPTESVSDVIEHVSTVVDDKDVKVSQTELADEPPPIADVASWSFEAISKTVYQIFPDVVVAPSLVIAGTDSKHYASISDNNYRFLPSRLGPDDIKRIHGDNERISIANYSEIIRFYIQLLRNTAGDAGGGHQRSGGLFYRQRTGSRSREKKQVNLCK